MSPCTLNSVQPMQRRLRSAARQLQLAASLLVLSRRPLTAGMTTAAPPALHPPNLDVMFHVNCMKSRRPTKRQLRTRLRLVRPSDEHATLPQLSRVGGVDGLLGRLYPPEALEEPTRDSDAWSEHNHRARIEFESYFADKGYSASGRELDGECAVRLLRDAMRLSPTDTLLDLGSSTGRVPILASYVCGCERVLGVELSPSRHALAERALRELARVDEGAARRVELMQADLMDAPLGEFGVIYCAVQPSGAQRLMPVLMPVLRDAIIAAAAGGAIGGHAPVRFFAAGFDLPADVPGITPRLVAGHIFAPPGWTDEEGTGPALRGIPLYGLVDGPRTVLEYELHVGADAGGDGGPGADRASSPRSSSSAATQSSAGGEA